MNRADEQAVLRQFQELLGMSSFKITTENGILHDDTEARADCDFVDKTIKITKGQEYKKFSDERKRSTLIHELIECRILWMDQQVQDKTQSIIYEEREELVNTLTRVLERLK